MDIMRRNKISLTEPQIAVVMRHLMEALYYLHAARKIHRDIKAANVMVNSKGQVKLADFGIGAYMRDVYEQVVTCHSVAQLSDEVKRRGSFIGTP